MRQQGTETCTRFNGPANEHGYVNQAWIIVGCERGFHEPIYWDGCFAESSDPADAAIVRSEEVADQIVKAMNKKYNAKFRARLFRDDL